MSFLRLRARLAGWASRAIAPAARAVSKWAGLIRLFVLAASFSRAGLGQDTFEAAWAEGQAMSLEQAVAYALEES